MIEGLQGLAHMLIQTPGEFLKEESLIVEALWCTTHLSKLQKHELTSVSDVWD